MSSLKLIMYEFCLVFIFVQGGIAQDAKRLVFLNQPETVFEGQNFSLQVAVVDLLGNIITDADDVIHIALQAQPSIADLAGTTSAVAVNGIATFPNLTVSQVGAYRLAAHKPVHVVGHWKENDPADHSENDNAQPPPNEFSIRPQHEEQQSGHNVYADIWGEGDFAYIGSIFPGGVRIIDISDPMQPVLAYRWRRDAAQNQFNDVKVQDGIGYFASDNGSGVFILDLSDPYQPRELARITAQNQGYDSVHNLYIDGDYLYLASFRHPEIGVFNVSDPANPYFMVKILSAFEPPVHDITVQGGILFSSSTGLNRQGFSEIFDVSMIEDGYSKLGEFDSGNGTHSNWPMHDNQYLAVALEARGKTVSIWDIRNPAEARKVIDLVPLTLDAPPFSPHNPLVSGNRLYVSWYQVGLQIFDITDVNQPRLVGFYDTLPQSSVESFSGAWGVYPFLGADRVLVSDTENGLFILDTTAADAEVAISDTFTVTPATSIEKGSWILY